MPFPLPYRASTAQANRYLLEVRPRSESQPQFGHLVSGNVDEAENFFSGVDVTAIRHRNCVLTGKAIVAEAKGQFEQAHQLYADADGGPIMASYWRRGKLLLGSPAASSR
jgi:hypothetical protein